MTDASMDSGPKKGSLTTVDARTKKRNAAEKRFKAYGIVAILIGMFFLVVLAASILRSGLPAFTQAEMKLEFVLSQEEFDAAEGQLLKTKAYEGIFISKLQDALTENGMSVTFDAAAIERLLGKPGSMIREYFRANPDKIGTSVTFSLPASSRVDGYFKGRVSRETVVDSRFFEAKDLDVYHRISERISNSIS